MKVTIEIDCTPEEARRALGLPDLAPLHELYTKKLQEAVAGSAVTPDVVGDVLRGFTAAGGEGFDFWRKLLGGAAGGVGGAPGGRPAG